MNKQEVFDKIVNHMLTQNAKALDVKGICMYRGEEGRMCAVGCLITDEAYSPDIEKNAADTEEVLQALRNSGIDIAPWSPSNADSRFLNEIQQIHDYIDVDVWEKALIRFAEKNSLLFNWRP